MTALDGLLLACFVFGVVCFGLAWWSPRARPRPLDDQPGDFDGVGMSWWTANHGTTRVPRPTADCKINTAGDGDNGGVH